MRNLKRGGNPLSRKRDPLSLILRVLVIGFAALTFAILLLIIGYILIRGIPQLKTSLWSPVYTTKNVSLLPALINTILITALSLGIAVPLGIATAIYLAEYAKSSSRLVRVVRAAAQTLAGFPSIVYGLFGLLFFVSSLGWGYSLLSGAFTLAIMILPLIIRTSEEALHSVPQMYREGSFALGAGKLATIFLILLPAAGPGILAGVILGIGRILGETAALIYTAGTVPQIPRSLLSSGRTLAVHLYALSSEGLYLNEANATAVVLLALTAGINWFSAVVARRMAA
ncbi:MAG: phosphate ABC transporter permease PstA [Spirochaetaceae bacterium]|jgi:phosphate transport system permease protein|nr:phosphate ABC transporter permease PstA [Spirochaetaceae bacterium]